MRELHAIFADDPQHDATLPGDGDFLHAECFEEVRASGMLKGRKVIGLWRIDKSAEHEDIIEIIGRVPTGIQTRYYAWKASMMERGRP